MNSVKASVTNTPALRDQKAEYYGVLDDRKRLLRERVAAIVDVLRRLPEAQIKRGNHAALQVGPNVGFHFPHGFEAYDPEVHSDLMFETLQWIMLDGDLLVILDIATTEARIVATRYIEQYFEHIYEQSKKRPAQAAVPSNPSHLLEGTS